MYMNGTRTILNHELLLIEDKQMKCIADKELHAHIFASVFIGTLFMKIWFVIFNIFFFISINNPRWYYSTRTILVNDLSWIYEGERYSSLLPLIRVEMILTIIYMSLAFICTQFGLSNTGFSVTSRILTHWFFEASSYLVILVAVFSEICVDREDDLANHHLVHTVSGFLMKISVFVLMRYAEHVPDSFVRDLKMSFFKIYCKPI